MSRIQITGLLLLCACLVLTGCTKDANEQQQDTTKARLDAIAGRIEDIKPGLGEIMSVVQQHHAKLFYSGSAGNWELADYQLDEIKEGLDSAVKFYPKFKEVKAPLSELIPSMMHVDLERVADAIKKKNKGEFTKSFQSLTVSCNRCHQAAEHSFIVIQVPGASEFTNQKFTK